MSATGGWHDLAQQGAALADSEARFRSIFQASPIGIAVVGLDGSWLRINPALAKIIGYDETELLARDFQSITHPDDLAADLALVQQLLAGEIPDYQMRKRYLGKDGRTVWCLLSVTLLRDEHGAPLHFLSQIVDVDAEHAATAVVEAVLTTLPDPVFLIEATGRVRRANAAAEELLGRSEAELHHIAFSEVVVRGSQDVQGSGVAAQVPEGLKSGRSARPVVDELLDAGSARVLVSPRGVEERWVDLRANRVPGSDLIIVTAYDVTDEVTRQQVERQQARLERVQLRQIIEAQREIAACKDVAEAFALVVERALALVPAAEGAAVQLLEDAGEQLRNAAASGTLGHSVGRMLPVSGSLSEMALLRRTAVHREDIAVDALVTAAACRDLSIASVVVVPLLDANEPVGVLEVVSSRPDAFDGAAEQQVTLLAQALSGAVRHGADAQRSQQLLARAEVALQALAVSEQRFHAAFSDSPTGMLLTTLGGHLAAQVVQANTVFAQMVGRTVEELVGTAGAALVHPEDLPALAAALDPVAARELPSASVQVRLVRPDGSRVWADLHGALIAGSGGADEHFVLQVQDVTQDRLLREQLA